MRNYQPKKKNPYQLPHNVYMQCLYAVRDYDRLKEEMRDILHSSPGAPDGMPRGSGISDSTVNKAIRREALQQRCDAIEEALVAIPAEYRKGVMALTMDETCPMDASPETYRRWRRRFLYEVAQQKCML
jgi:hypothetical protein